MKKGEYNRLVDRAMSLIAEAIPPEMRGQFTAWETLFRELPKCKSTIRTAKGIVGYNEYCLSVGNFEHFMFNTTLDVVECCKNHQESWFSPRLGRFAGDADGNY